MDFLCRNLDCSKPLEILEPASVVPSFPSHPDFLRSGFELAHLTKARILGSGVMALAFLDYGKCARENEK
jgi:hypothetical protein